MFRRLIPIRIPTLALAMLALLALCAPVEAGPQRARLSRDLADHLGAGGTEPVRVIVRGSREAVAALAARHGATPKRWLQTAGVLEVTPEQLQALADDPEVISLSGDVPVHPTMAVTNQAIGTELLQAVGAAGKGLTGRGVGIAVVDSGIALVPAIRERVVASVDFTGGAGEDAFGHGTHVAGIIAAAADDTLPVVTERYQGVAPGAHLVNLRVLDGEGAGRVSDVIRAVEWAVANRRRYGIRVINLSLGHPVFESAADDPLCEAVERAVAAGMVVVAAAGNLGKTADGTPVIGGIESPGNSPYAITVGALNTKQTGARSDDVVATYSSRGPTPYDFTLKPDLVAPGNRIVSLEAPGSTLAMNYGGQHMAGSGDRSVLPVERDEHVDGGGLRGGGAAARGEPQAGAAEGQGRAAARGQLPARGGADRRGRREPERGGVGAGGDGGPAGAGTGGDCGRGGHSGRGDVLESGWRPSAP